MTTQEYKVASTDELDDGERKIIELDGQEIAIFRIEGEYHALVNYCVHQSGPLCEGPLSGQTEVDEDMMWQYTDGEKLVTCPWHAWKFDVTTGENVKDSRYKVPKYEVEVRDDSIYVMR